MEIEKIFNQLDTIKISKYKNKLRLYQKAIGRLYSTQNMLEEKITTLKRKLAESKKVDIYSRLINDNDVLKLEISDNEMYNNAIVILSISKNRVLNYISEEFIELIGIKDCNFTVYDGKQIDIIYPEIGNIAVCYQLTVSNNRLRLMYDAGSDHKYLIGLKNHIDYFSSSRIYYNNSNTIFNHSNDGKIIYEPDEEVIKIENKRVETILKGIDNADTDDTKDKE